MPPKRKAESSQPYQDEDFEEDGSGDDEKFLDGNTGMKDGMRIIGKVKLEDGEGENNDDDVEDDDDDDDDDDDEDLEFEEEDEVVMDEDDEEDDEEGVGKRDGSGSGNIGMSDSKDASGGAVQPKVKDVYRPGVDAPLAEGETLEYDPSAYVMLHRLHLEWSCLSFDVMPDNLGIGRSKFPLSTTLICGTQADKPSNNKLMVTRLSNLVKTQEKDEDEDDDEDDEDEEDEDPVVDVLKVPHQGSVNRVRVMPQEPHVVATWAETGRVHLWDLRHVIGALDAAPAGSLGEKASNTHATAVAKGTSPVVSWAGHGTEGYALDWSRKSPGRLASGDCDGNIFVWDVDNAAAAAALSPLSSSSSSSSSSSRDMSAVWKVDGSTAYTSHAGSVEDIQWSPNEANVFASCGVDGTVRIWDTRARGSSGCKLTTTAHTCDVNVISWSGLVSFLLLSGADDGGFKIWDLRNFKAASPVANFTWHKQPITSIEWAPDDENTLCVASSDGSVSVWDMSLEDDAEAELAMLPGGKGVPSSLDPRLSDIPPQLLFLHQGQTDTKEAHFHRQIPGLVLSTALEGINAWIPDISTTT